MRYFADPYCRLHLLLSVVLSQTPPRCSGRRVPGTGLCSRHRDEIFGLWLPVVYIRHARLGKGTWVVKVGSPYDGRLNTDDKALGFRSWERARDEADYEARLIRWKAAQGQADRHSCDGCRAEHVAGRRQRAQASRVCPYNVAAAWLADHTEPQPPEA
jgi:hypothetical protein